MNEVICPRCGAAIPEGSAFCQTCGTPLAAQPPAAPAGGSPPDQPAATQPPPPVAFPTPPSNAYPPPPPVAIAAPPGVYPPGFPAVQVAGNNTKWAIGLGIASLFCCGPFAAVPGIFLAKKDMDDIAAGRAPLLNDGWAKGAFYLNIASLGISILFICLFWGRLGMLWRHF